MQSYAAKETSSTVAFLPLLPLLPARAGVEEQGSDLAAKQKQC